jgi:hypothetical protein
LTTYYHIVNGDALRAQFPKNITGEVIVARECLVDGDVHGDSLDEFFTTRANFFNCAYGENPNAYQQNVVAEFQRIQKLPANAEINLWFEDDLFCQVNFWFVSYLLANASPPHKAVYLVRPLSHSPYSFGHLSEAELQACLERKIHLNDLKTISNLWRAYQQNDMQTLIDKAQQIQTTLPFILPAVQAHIDRIPAANDPGRPIHALRTIIKELNTQEFGPIFKEFCKREAIYGFGDVQVKKLVDQIITN